MSELAKNHDGELDTVAKYIDISSVTNGSASFVEETTRHLEKLKRVVWTGGRPER